MDKFAHQIEAVGCRVAKLHGRAEELPLQQQELLVEAFEELESVLEQLQLTEEELHQQNEELAAAREEVEAERQRYQELFEFAPDGYLVTDAEGTIREANRAAAELLNVSQQFLVGLPLIIFVAEEDRLVFHSELTRLHQVHRVQEWAIRLSRRNGANFDAALTVTAVCNQENKPIALHWLLREISKRSSAEQEMQASKRRFHQIADITERSSAEEALRQQTERARLTHLASAIHQAQLYQHLSALNTDLERQVQERTVELQQKIQELQELNTLKDDFLSTVSHELRTPLANMKIAIEMLKTAPSPERQLRYLEICQAECNREADLINDLLDLQQLEAQSYPISSREAVNLQDWLPSIVEPFHSRVQESQQTLQMDLPPDLPTVEADGAGLGRVLAELLNNACKYTPAGGEILLRVRYHSAPPVMTFTISNQAEIPAAALSRIFEKFYRIPHNDPWKQGGTGLGLALVQKLVEQLGGTIQVESGGGWTTFTVQLAADGVMW